MSYIYREMKKDFGMYGLIIAGTLLLISFSKENSLENKVNSTSQSQPSLIKTNNSFIYTSTTNSQAY
jgi:hypothetical protein